MGREVKGGDARREGRGGNLQVKVIHMAAGKAGMQEFLKRFLALFLC